MQKRLLIPGLALLVLAPACTGYRTIADPTLWIETQGGIELGVSTDYGVAFLGRTAQAGNAKITAWFGDGPQAESVAIEPVGGGVFTAETEIRLPQARMNFVEPKAGDTVVVMGRRGSRTWSHEVTVRTHPKVEGILLPVISEIANAPNQIGAGVFVQKKDEANPQFVGLVSGVLTLTDAGKTESYLTVVGMRDLWRLVAHRREIDRSQKPVYREDVQ